MRAAGTTRHDVVVVVINFARGKCGVEQHSCRFRDAAHAHAMTEAALITIPACG